MDQHDPFAFIIDLCHISPSQEELLRRCAFVGEPDDKPPPCSAGAPLASSGILMVSLSETQDHGKDATAPGSDPQDQDVFHTPPEKSSSLPTSGDEPLDHCIVNRALDVDDDTLEFVDLRGDSEGTVCVDLGRDSDLGFSEVQLTQEIDAELVDGSSLGIKRDAVGDKFEGFERELASQDGIGELPMKRLKLSDPKSGFDSSRACLGIESQKLKEDNGNCKGKRGSGVESPSCNVGADQKTVQAGEQGSGDNGISMQKILGSRLENAANGLEYGEGGQQKDKISVFDVLKLVSENSDDEDEDDLENVSLLEAFKSRGLTFPRPRWWPDNDNYRKQRIA